VRLLYSGSLSRRKGVDLLAQAFARVAANTPRLHLDVLGEGPLREKMASHLEPVSDQVTFHGFVKWKNLPEYYASADVLIAPSRYDGWGLVVPEGLAAGMPVIGTRRMGAAIDLIRPGETGWRLPAGDLGALVEVLQGIDRSNQRELHRMGRQAQEDVMSTHTLSDGATAFCEYAKSAVEQQSA
jgi:glycosyltransferase involved in cell wall biosynthesis